MGEKEEKKNTECGGERGEQGERGTGIGSDWRRRRCTRGGRDQETSRCSRLNLVNVPTFAERKNILVLKY